MGDFLSLPNIATSPRLNQTQLTMSWATAVMRFRKSDRILLPRRFPVPKLVFLVLNFVGKFKYLRHFIISSLPVSFPVQIIYRIVSYRIRLVSKCTG